MYKGIITDELKEAYRRYMELHEGMAPDEYIFINFEKMSYEHFLSYIKKANECGCDILDVIPKPIIIDD